MFLRWPRCVRSYYWSNGENERRLVAIPNGISDNVRLGIINWLGLCYSTQIYILATEIQ